MNCPRCGSASIVYNANYYCRRPSCRWVHDPSNKTEQAKLVAALERGDIEKVNR